MIKRILVTLSGTRFTEAAIRHAVELAGRHGAALTGITDVDLVRVEFAGAVPIGAGGAAKELQAHRRRVTEGHVRDSIEQFSAMAREADVPYTVHEEVGEPFEHLIDLWRYHDLTIAELQGLFEYETLHNPDDMLVRLIGKGIRPIVAVAAEHRTVKRALIAYNGSVESAKTMKRFIQMRPWPDPELMIVCFDRISGAGKLLRDAREYCAMHGYDAQTEHVEGSPRELLLETAAEWGADLIVMGATSRARIVRHLLGDTALEAIRRAEVPLFLAQ